VVTTSQFSKDGHYRLHIQVQGIKRIGQGEFAAGCEIDKLLMFFIGLGRF
jgi:hypothetical protein